MANVTAPPTLVTGTTVFAPSKPALSSTACRSPTST
jgi:hypothetical protein